MSSFSIASMTFFVSLISDFDVSRSILSNRADTASRSFLMRVKILLARLSSLSMLLPQ